MSSGIAGEGVLRKLIQQMNSNAPARRLRLLQLLLMKEPCFVDKSGREIVIERGELDMIAELLRVKGYCDVKLPIVLIADAGQTESMWRVEGEAECAVISAVLGRRVHQPCARLFLYGPHVAALRRKLPTSTTCVFVP